MDRPDARYLPKNVQEYLRKQAIRLRENGETFVAIAHFLGVNRNTVAGWWKLYLAEGQAALSQYHRGRVVGEGRTLTPQQEEEILQVLQTNAPGDVAIDSALWTRRAIQALIEQRFQITLPIRTVGSYLQRWGFTPQKPVSRANEQDPKQVLDWIETQYPQLKKRAQQENAEIAWEDEAGRRNTDQVGRSFAPKGQTPEIRLPLQKRRRVNYLGCVTNGGRMWFMTYTHNFESSTMLEFMRRLIRQASCKLFLIVDRHAVHTSKAVKIWLQRHREEIELFFLPSYSPELNPTEYLNGDVKQGVHSAAPTQNLEQLRQGVQRVLWKIQKMPQRVLSYFRHPAVAYALA